MHSETDAPRIIAFMRWVRSQPTETMRGAQGQLLERGRDACERRIEAGPEARNDGYDGNGKPAAMRPYSMAVAPVSSRKKLLINVLILPAAS
jgi:hypothetical protein